MVTVILLPNLPTVPCAHSSTLVESLQDTKLTVYQHISNFLHEFDVGLMEYRVWHKSLNDF